MKPETLMDKKFTTHCRPSSEAERQLEIASPTLTWEMLAALEPDLLHLLDAARSADSNTGGDHFCGQQFWLQELKPDVLNLVGYGRRDHHPILGTSAAYDLAYRTLLKAVPECRDCPLCE